MKQSDTRFREIFEKSPLGILFYDKEGKLADSNQSARDILGIPEDASGVDLFDIFAMASLREELLKKELIRFQTLLDFEDIKNHGFYTPTRSGTVSMDITIFVVDSGFSAHVQDISLNVQNEEKYRSFFEDDLTGDFIATPEGRITDCNPAFSEIYGFQTIEKACEADISQFNPDDWRKLIRTLKREGKIEGHQSWHQRPDEEKIHVVTNVVGIFNHSQELVQVKGYIFDDTERKKAEKALKESEEKYHRLFDEDLTGDFIATPQGEILECNPAFADIYGFNDVESARRWNISQSNSFDWPYMVTRLKSEGKIQGFQSWQRRSDGLKIHVTANLVGIFNHSQELVQVKGYVFDDTERKKAENALNRSKSLFKEILDSVKDGFMALNPYWDFIYLNQCAAEYFGRDAEDLIGQNLWKMFPELEGTIYERLFRNALENEEIQHFEGHSGLKPDQWLDFVVYPSDEGVTVFWRDITHKKPWNKD